MLQMYYFSGMYTVERFCFGVSKQSRHTNHYDKKNVLNRLLNFYSCYLPGLGLLI